MGTIITPGSLLAQTSLLKSGQDRTLQQIKSQKGSRDDAKIEKGAKEFEAMLLSTWLQQAEQSFATVPGTDDDSATGRDQMMSLGVQSLATSLAASGGIGIGSMIAKAMHAQADKVAVPVAAEVAPGDAKRINEKN